MKISMRCGRDDVELTLPDSAVVYESRFPAPVAEPAGLVLAALNHPTGSPTFAEVLAKRRDGPVVEGRGGGVPRGAAHDLTAAGDPRRRGSDS